MATETDVGRVGKPTGCSRAEPEEVSALRASPPRAAYTPGPWLVHATNRVVVQADGAFANVTVENGKVVGDDSDMPCSICLLRDPGEGFSEDETLANGFLIAAAPDMFNALREARLAMETLARRVFNDNGDHTINTEPLDPDVFSACYYAQRSVVEALAKARGSHD